MSYGDGDGAVQSVSRKHKLNAKSSTESELAGVNNVSVMMLWTKLLLEEQGYDINSNILYQENKSAILLETNGKKSSGKRTRALNICYFFLTDQVEKGNVTIVYCPTDDMVGDSHTKPLQGEKFQKLGCPQLRIRKLYTRSSGIVSLLAGGGAIYYRTRIQAMVAQSSTIAEFGFMSDADKVTLYIRYI
jgi:hypothetical protein